jgi:hypothetical protein
METGMKQEEKGISIDEALRIGNDVFFERVEEVWRRPYIKKRHHAYDTRSIALRGRVTDIREKEFKALLHDNNGFEKDGEEFVFSKTSLFCNQNFKDFQSLGQWKYQEPEATT